MTQDGEQVVDTVRLRQRQTAVRRSIGWPCRAPNGQWSGGLQARTSAFDIFGSKHRRRRETGDYFLDDDKRSAGATCRHRREVRSGHHPRSRPTRCASSTAARDRVPPAGRRRLRRRFATTSTPRCWCSSPSTAARSNLSGCGGRPSSATSTCCSPWSTRASSASIASCPTGPAGALQWTVIYRVARPARLRHPVARAIHL